MRVLLFCPCKLLRIDTMSDSCLATIADSSGVGVATTEPTLKKKSANEAT